MRNQLFQEQALERLSSPEQLDRLMPLTSPRGWLALAGIGLLLAAGLVWSFVGTVETIIKAEGVFTAPGVVVPDANLTAVAFVPAAEGYRVRTGMTVSIKPASDDPQSSNHLQGTVKSVGRRPATQASVEQLLQNESWTSTTLAAGPVLQVDIELADVKSSERVFSGLPCTAQIVIQRQRPIDLVLPSLSGN